MIAALKIIIALLAALTLSQFEWITGLKQLSAFDFNHAHSLAYQASFTFNGCFTQAPFI